MYIELDHNLKPGKINDINKNVVLTGQTRKEEADQPFKASTLNVNKYELQKGHMKQFLQKIEQNPSMA